MPKIITLSSDYSCRAQGVETIPNFSSALHACPWNSMFGLKNLNSNQISCTWYSGLRKGWACPRLWTQNLKPAAQVLMLLAKASLDIKQPKTSLNCINAIRSLYQTPDAMAEDGNAIYTGRHLACSAFACASESIWRGIPREVRQALPSNLFCHTN